MSVSTIIYSSFEAIQRVQMTAYCHNQEKVFTLHEYIIILYSDTMYSDSGYKQAIGVYYSLLLTLEGGEGSGDKV